MKTLPSVVSSVLSFSSGAFFLLLPSCGSEIDTAPKERPEEIPLHYAVEGEFSTIRDGIDVTFSVASQAGFPVAHAKVTLHSGVYQASAITDLTGFAAIPFDRASPRGYEYAVIEADGFAPSVVPIQREAGKDAFDAVVTLLPIPFTQTFAGSSGVTADYVDVRVVIPPNAVVDQDGNLIAGDVQIHIVPVDPSDPLDLAAAPPLLALPRNSRSLVDLESFFMADITLTVDGRPANLAAGKKATLTFVLPEAMQNRVTVGETIPAWYFDVEQGIWIEEGSGTVRQLNNAQQPSGNYPTRKGWVAEVPHFTFWNADKPIDEKQCVRVKVIDDTFREPVSGALITVSGVDYAARINSQLTGSSGESCVEVKRGGTINVQVTHPNFSSQAPAPFIVTVPDTAAECSENDDICIPLEIVMSGATCVGGVLAVQAGDDFSDLPEDERPVVTARFDANDGKRIIRAQHVDADGLFCFDIPESQEILLRANSVDQKRVSQRKTFVAPSGVGGSCNDISTCFALDEELFLSDLPTTGCMTGTALGLFFNNPDIGSVASVGTPIYVFEANSFRSINCGVPVEEWGTLLSQGNVLDQFGTFVVDNIPLGDDEIVTGGLDVVVIAGSCLNWGPSPLCAGVEFTTLRQRGNPADGTCEHPTDVAFFRCAGPEL